MKRYLLGILAFSLFFAGSHPGSNGSAPETRQEQTQLRHEVKVTLKLVQVSVTDKKGRPVIDLTKDDFIVFDEGQRQTLTEFERHVLALPSAEEADPPEIVATPTPPSRDLIPRKFFLLFDFAFNNGIGIEKSRKAALHFIDTHLQPQDEIGLLSYSAIKSLTVHENITSDHEAVRKAVRRIGIEQIAGRAESFEAEYWQAKSGVNPVDASKPGTVFVQKEVFSDPFESNWGRYRQESKLQAQNFARKMTDLAKALRYIPGHKHILLLSSGVPYSLVYGIQSPYGVAGAGELGEFWLQEKFEEMFKELSASNCTIFAIDTEELRAKIGGDTRTQGAPTLQKMTSSTGGKYFGNINNYEQHIQKIQDLTGCYYVLGYYVDDKWDGAYHRIKVEVTRPGLDVHAQKGYFNPKPFTEYNDLERMLHLVDLALSEEPVFQRPVRFPLEAVPCPEEGKGNLCLEAEVPLEEIGEVLTGRSEFVAVIFDVSQNIVALKRNEWERSALAGKWFTFGAAFSVPPGKYQCRLVIRNLETGRAAVASAAAVIQGK